MEYNYMFFFSSELKYLKLELRGVYNSQFSPDVQEAEVDISLTKLHCGRKVISFYLIQINTM